MRFALSPLRGAAMRLGVLILVSSGCVRIGPIRDLDGGGIGIEERRQRGLLGQHQLLDALLLGRVFARQPSQRDSLRHARHNRDDQHADHDHEDSFDSSRQDRRRAALIRDHGIQRVDGVSVRGRAGSIEF